MILPPPARDALFDVVPRVDVPWLFVTRSGRQVSEEQPSLLLDPSFAPRSYGAGMALSAKLGRRA